MKHLSSSSSSSSLPLKRISTKQLQPGMYLVRIVDSWWKSPFFLHRRTIQTQEEIQLLLQAGIQSVEIDLSRGLNVGGEDDCSPVVPAEDLEGPYATEGPMTGNSPPIHGEPGFEAQPCSDFENRQRVRQLRKDLDRSMNDIFEGLKTGHALPMPSLHQMAESIFQEVTQHPVMVTEVMLLENMETYDKTLHGHVLDVAILSVLLGIQLDISANLLHELAVAGLLHDVGFLRLPANVVKAPAIDRTALPPVLRQHVNVGVALIRQHAKGSSLIHRMVGEHHEYMDGSGYPRHLADESISEGGKLLGLVDYFDELVSPWGNSNWLPPALALRRIFQEVREGRFPVRMGEALIRTLGVFPVGTVLQLSSGEIAVVASHQAQAGIKPVVLVVSGVDGAPLSLPHECQVGDDHSLDHPVAIQKILQPTEVPFDWQTLLSRWRHNQTNTGLEEPTTVPSSIGPL